MSLAADKATPKQWRRRNHVVCSLPFGTCIICLMSCRVLKRSGGTSEVVSCRVFLVAEAFNNLNDYNPLHLLQDTLSAVIHILSQNHNDF